MSFNCTSSFDVRWELDGGSPSSNVVTGREGVRYWIKLPSVQLKDAGTYSCITEKDMILITGSGKLEVQGKH